MKFLIKKHKNKHEGHNLRQKKINKRHHTDSNHLERFSARAETKRGL